jgi:copper chaperone
MAHIRLKIMGMSCGHCVAAVERALDGVEGVQKRQVSVGVAEIDYDPACTTPERITAAVTAEGYQPQVT